MGNKASSEDSNNPDSKDAKDFDKKMDKYKKFLEEMP